jgi:hypothetical protein
MKQKDIDYCKEHIINFESVKLGFTRNIPFDVLGEYERMYRDYLDAQFLLTYWCGECVFDMLKRLIVLYEDSIHNFVQPDIQKAEEKIQTEVIQNTIEEVKKKRGRPKK